MDTQSLPSYLVPFLKLIAGPAFVWLLRKFAPTFIAKMPVWLQPVGAAFINVALAVATGADPVLSIAALVEALKAALLTGGIVKGIDLAKGKAATVTAEEKAAIPPAYVA